MPLSDLELETRLGDQRARIEEIAPPPFDLVQRVRQSAREQRRRRFALAAAGVTAALVFGGLPVLVSGLVGESSPEESAPSRRPSANYVPALSEIPTRGSLADDESWVEQARRLPWRSPGLAESLEDVELPDPPLDTRHVAFAGDVPGGRVALVLGRDRTFGHAWFVGPEGADPDELTLAALPGDAPERLPLALWAAPDPASEDQVLVVVGHPGDEVDVLSGREVSAAGGTTDLWQTVPMEDGAGAVAPELPFSGYFGVEFQVRRDGQRDSLYPGLTFGDHLLAAQDPGEVADPRGLLGAVDARQAQWAAESLLGHYGRSADQLRPTLLAGGSVAPGSTTSAVLVGVTFPSGATTTHLVVHWGSSEGMTSMNVLPDPAPAGTALLDRVIAIATPNALVVSGPSAGVTAEAYRADGTLLAAVPLRRGAGLAPLAPPSPAIAPLTTVRILDAGGDLVAEVPGEQG